MSSYTELASFLDHLAANSRKKEYAGPYEFDFATGGVWQYASDCKGIVLVRKPYWKFRVPVAAPDGEVGKRILRYLAVPEGESHTVSLMELRAFLGAGAWTKECPACKGASKKSEYVSCTVCDCDGEVGVEPRFSWLYGMPLDANRLACLLQPFEESEIQVVVSTPKGDNFGPEDKVVFVVGKDFRVVLMGMSPSLDEQDKWRESPRFSREKP